MNKTQGKSWVPHVVEALERLIGANERTALDEPQETLQGARYGPDLIVEVGGFRFVVEFKSASLVALIVAGIEKLKRYPAESPGIRLLVTPFMGKGGIEKCAEAGISWLDLSGNADITAPGLRLYVRGEKNKFTSPGRRENPFAPKSSRVARHLLYQPSRTWTQRELAEETGLGEGFVSRIVKSLEVQQLVARTNEGRLCVGKPSVMLEAWQQGYDFTKHGIIRGHVAGRSGEEIQIRISKFLRERSLEHAATGLGAAWLYSRFAAFRIVSFYLKEWPERELFEQIGFREDSAGANVWLIIPKDADVFWDVKPINDIPSVHRIQVWLDLRYHPERAEEAAAELRKTLDLQ